MNTYVKIGLTLAIGFGASIAFSKKIEKGLAKYYIHKFPRIQEIFNDTTSYDILYIGSSRTHTTIFPSVVDSITGLSGYNAGVEGGNFFEFKLTLDGYLAKHPSPKFGVLTIDCESFNLDKKIFFPVQYFQVLQNPAIRKTFKDLKEYKLFFIEQLSFLRLIYYDDYIKNLAVQGLLGQNELSHGNSFQNKGYLSNGYTCTDTLTKYKTQKIKLSKEGLEKMQAIIDTCKAKNIRVFLTYAPEYNFRYQSSFSNFDELVRIINDVAIKNNILFYRDDSLELCKNPCYFTNYGHVNTYGAIEYSKILGQRISVLSGNK